MACRQMYISFRNNIILKFVQKAKKAIAENLCELAGLGIGGQRLKAYLLEQAITFYQRSLEQDEEQPDVLFQIAEAAMELGDGDLAQAYYEKALIKGYDVQKVLLKEAELAYLRRDFTQLLAILGFLKKEPLAGDPETSLMRFWLGS